MAESSTTRDSAKNFWQRGFMTIIAAYLVGSWTFLEFLNFILERYLISHHWVDIFIILLIGLSPSAAFYAWNRDLFHQRGLMKKDKWAISSNVIAMLIIVGFFFGDKDLGAMTTTISYAGENGIEKKKVFKRDFADKILLSSFDNEDSDSSIWLSSGITHALWEKLLQFDGIVTDPGWWVQTTRERNDVMREIGSELLLYGTYSVSDSNYKVTARLEDVNHQVIHEQNFSGTKLLKIVDSITFMVKEKVRNSHYLVGQLDIPAEEIFTRHEEAYMAYLKGTVSKGIEIDSSFAIAYKMDAMLSYARGDYQRAKKMIDFAMNYRSRLPKRHELLTRAYYYLIHEDKESAFRMMDNYLEVYPNDNNTAGEIAWIFYNNSRFSRGIEILNKIVSNSRGLDRFIILLIYCYLWDGQYQDAENLISSLTEQYGFSSPLQLVLADLYILNKRWSEAFSTYDKLRLNNPSDSSYQSMLKVVNYNSEKSESEISKIIHQFEGIYISEDQNMISLVQHENLLKVESQKTISFGYFCNDSTVLKYPNELIYLNSSAIKSKKSITKDGIVYNLK